MRIPGSHPLVMGLIDRFDLKKRRFHYVDRDGKRVGKPLPEQPKGWARVGGHRVRGP
ncbi:hypothetical protein GCM10010415_66740 [Streptomyces atrovirens]|uniref:Uncharacterized protein n=1 Tax=Streptomyces atrovirens TaxID=285556 RepID=A0ABW0DPK9_9ACTN